MPKPWYWAGLSFQCTACGKCCSGQPGYVWVDQEEIQRMAQAMQLTEEEFRKRYVRRVGSRYSLKEYPDGDCILLDPKERHCLVYAARPIQCRTWPFWSSNLKSPESWQETCEICPGAGKGSLYSLEQIEIQRQQRERL
jgi:hypothetical protein